MKDNGFARHLTAFFTEYLACERGFSPNTIRSYSNTFTLLLTYLDDIQRVKADRIEMSHLTRKTIIAFLDWLQEEKNNKDTRRNQRLAAIHAFSRYMLCSMRISHT